MAPSSGGRPAARGRTRSAPASGSAGRRPSAAHVNAYNHGLAWGTPATAAEDADPALAAQYRRGAEARRTATGQGKPPPAGKPGGAVPVPGPYTPPPPAPAGPSRVHLSDTPSAADLAGSGSGAVLGGLAAALLINYLHNGPAGVRAWIAAKFLNRTSAGSWYGGTSTANATPGQFGKTTGTVNA